MSKYGPAWVWPATGQSAGQVPPLPAWSRRERRSDGRDSAPPPPSRLSGFYAESMSVSMPGQKQGWAPKKGRLWPQLQEKEKPDVKGLGEYPSQGSAPKCLRAQVQPRHLRVDRAGQG